MFHWKIYWLSTKLLGKVKEARRRYGRGANAVRSLSLTHLLHKGLKARILSDTVEVAVFINLIQEL